MNARELIERMDFARSSQYEALARKVLDAFGAHIDALMKRCFPSERDKLPASRDWGSLGTIKFSTFVYEGVRYCFYPKKNTTCGEFTPKDRTRFNDYNTITVFDETFDAIDNLRDAAATYCVRLFNKLEVDLEALAQGELYYERIKCALGSRSVLKTLVHEMQHERDNQRWPLARELDQRQALFNKKSRQNTLSQQVINKAYMGSTHEYNAYFTHALHSALRTSRPREGGPSFKQFKAIFINAFGKDHFDLMPAANQRKVLTRLYAAYQDAQNKV